MLIHSRLSLDPFDDGDQDESCTMRESIPLGALQEPKVIVDVVIELDADYPTLCSSPPPIPPMRWRQHGVLWERRYRAGAYYSGAVLP